MWGAGGRRGKAMCSLFDSDIALVFFFFQAEDGIRDLTVTGVQTCALPIWFTESPQSEFGHTHCRCQLFHIQTKQTEPRISREYLHLHEIRSTVHQLPY